MKTTLKDGSVIEAKVFYSPFNKKRPTHRRTDVVVTLPDGGTFTASAATVKGDTFRRAEGRKIVAEKVLAGMRSCGYAKELRTAVFNVLCPEHTKQRISRQEIRNRLTSLANVPVSSMKEVRDALNQLITEI